MSNPAIIGKVNFTIRRYSAVSYDANGRAVAGTYTDTAVFDSLQQASSDDLRLLPEGKRHGEWKVIYTEADIRTADDDNSIRADHIIYGGREYEVHSVDIFDQGILNHRKAMACLIVQQEEA